jgi:hypothetical protein
MRSSSTKPSPSPAKPSNIHRADSAAGKARPKSIADKRPVASDKTINRVEREPARKLSHATNVDKAPPRAARQPDPQPVAPRAGKAVMDAKPGPRRTRKPAQPFNPPRRAGGSR